VSDDLKPLTEQVTALRLDMARMETKIDGIKDLTKKVEEVDDRSKEALQSTRSAHKRIDALDKYEDVSTKALDNSLNAHARLDKIDKWVFWFGTTLFGAIIVAAVAFMVRGGFSK
jgi:hypothetical protein